MEVVILPSAAEGAVLVADAVSRLLSTRHPVLGLATGSSPLGVYRELLDRHRRGALSFQGAQCFLLDEYVGLPAGHPESYRSVIQRELTAATDLPAGALRGLDGAATDLPAECARYEDALVVAGGVGLQLLGVGTDGHVGFNEPGSSLASRTRLKTLTRTTREDNARFFGGDVAAVPRHVLTEGLGTILDARHLVLLAAGEAKAAAVAAAVEGPVSASCPASVLQLHPHVTVVLDEAAAGALAHAGYHREAWAGKPGWQEL